MKLNIIILVNRTIIVETRTAMEIPDFVMVVAVKDISYETVKQTCQHRTTEMVASGIIRAVIEAVVVVEAVDTTIVGAEEIVTVVVIIIITMTVVVTIIITMIEAVTMAVIVINMVKMTIVDMIEKKIVGSIGTTTKDMIEGMTESLIGGTIEIMKTGTVEARMTTLVTGTSVTEITVAKEDIVVKITGEDKVLGMVQQEMTHDSGMRPPIRESQLHPWNHRKGYHKLPKNLNFH